MIKFKAERDVSQAESCDKMVHCPECGQKLTDIKYVNGAIMLRIKCRRCKTYINVDVVGAETHCGLEQR